MNKIKILLYLLRLGIAFLLLIACNSNATISNPTNTPIFSSTLALAATNIPPTSTFIFPSATNTLRPTPKPFDLSISLFFDMNGSGLRDETSFYYWENFFDPETFKGRPELLETIMDLGKPRFNSITANL